MPGVHVGKSAYFLVIASQEGGTRVHTTGGYHYRPVHFDPKREQALGLVHIYIFEQYCARRTKFLLQSDNNVSCLLQITGNVKESEQNAVWSGPHKIVEISAAPLSIIDSPQVSIANLRDLCLKGVLPRHDSGPFVVQ